MKKWLTLCLAALFLFAAACGEPAAPQPAVSEATPEPTPEEPEIVAIDTPAPTEVPATPEPTPEPTPTPTPTPSPTPTRPGDIAVNFPDYDTGVDADYSYQSDELRIAITVHEEILPDVLENRDLPSRYYVADIWVRNIRSMRQLFAKGQFNRGTLRGDQLAKQGNAILAINTTHTVNVPELFLDEGKLYLNAKEAKSWNSKSVCLIYKDGSMKTFYIPKGELDIDKEIANGAWFGWQFGPIIIRNYKDGPGATKSKRMGYRARTMLGYYEPGHYAIVVVDHRGDKARGVSNVMMVDIMKSVGVRDAFNLDGENSTILTFMGEVISKPVYNRMPDGTVVYGRPIPNMLGFGEYDAETDAFVDLSTLTASKFLGKD